MGMNENVYESLLEMVHFYGSFNTILRQMAKHPDIVLTIQDGKLELDGHSTSIVAGVKGTLLEATEFEMAARMLIEECEKRACSGSCGRH